MSAYELHQGWEVSKDDLNIRIFTLLVRELQDLRTVGVDSCNKWLGGDHTGIGYAQSRVTSIILMHSSHACAAQRFRCLGYKPYDQTC